VYTQIYDLVDVISPILFCDRDSKIICPPKSSYVNHFYCPTNAVNYTKLRG